VAGKRLISETPLAVAGIKTIKCEGSYDYPHLGKSSAYKKVNAHFTVTCVGTIPSDARFTQLTISSKMLDTTDGRVGLVSRTSGRGRVMVGGDLACLAPTHRYRAVGAASILFPPGYTSGSAQARAKSVEKRLARDPDTGNRTWR